MPTRSPAARQAVTSTTESPMRTMTEPAACLASLPVSNLMILSPMATSRVVISSRGSQGSLGSLGSRGSEGSRRLPSPRGSLANLVNPVHLVNPVNLFADVQSLDQVGVTLRVLR